MPKLTDVLGAIMADIAAARRVADLQTLRIAKQYREDPLLRGMTVPRIRLPEVVLEVPLIIEGCEVEQPAKPPAQAGSPAAAPAAPAKTQEPGEGFVSLGADVLRRLKESENSSTTAKVPATVPKPASRGEPSDSRSECPAPYLKVLVTAEEIKARGEPGAVSKLRLVLREEGLEWSNDDGDDERGETQARLIPE
jgi:hypothetical protein